MAMGRELGAAFILAMIAGGPPDVAYAQNAPADATSAGAKDESLEASVAKMNAYVALLNRSLRAVQSLDRYKSWVNMKTGPTGRESIVYGLYQVYDTSKEAEKAFAALTRQPLLPELDTAMRDYIAANAALGPILNEASAYYEREDYKTDRMAGGKALHVRIVAVAMPFLAARARAYGAFRDEKARLDERQLAAIEQREGRGADWHVVNVMTRARRVIDLLPSNASPVVDLARFDAAMASYASAVKEMDTYGAGHPNAFFVFESQPRSLLGKLRDFQEKIDRAKGDARRAGGDDITWIVNDYNLMVTTSQTATQFNH
jgi:hypothetical protein